MEIKRIKKKDARAYTFMVVPHRGTRTYSMSMPIFTLKKCLAGLLVLLICFGSWQMRNLFIVWRAQEDQGELAHLRATKDVQEEKIQNLARAAQELEGEMAKIEQLEQEVRRSLDGEAVSAAGVSRSGASRFRFLPAAAERLSPVPDVDVLALKVAQLNTLATEKKKVLTELNRRLVERNAIRAATPSVWPASGVVTSRFGMRSSPAGMGSTMHKGLDIAGDYGSPVYATADGVVEIASVYYGFGYYILIDHGYGTKTAYGHNSALLVNAGQSVRKGELIAYMGNSGVSTGTHLHYEVIRNGVQVDPAGFL